MARIFKRKKSTKNINRKNVKSNIVDFISFTKEKKIDYISEEVESNRMNRYEELKKFYETKTDYLVVEKWEDISAVWGPAYANSKTKFKQKRMMFLLWKFSGLNVKTETEEQSEYLESLDDKTRQAIEFRVLQERGFPTNYIIDEFGEVNLTKRGEITRKNPIDGGNLFAKVPKGEPSYPIYESLKFDHLPYYYIKAVVDSLNGSDEKTEEQLEIERLRKELEKRDKELEKRVDSDLIKHKVKALSEFVKAEGLPYSGTRETLISIILENNLKEKFLKLDK